MKEANWKARNMMPLDRVQLSSDKDREDFLSLDL